MSLFLVTLTGLLNTYAQDLSNSKLDHHGLSVSLILIYNALNVLGHHTSIFFLEPIPTINLYSNLISWHVDHVLLLESLWAVFHSPKDQSVKAVQVEHLAEAGVHQVRQSLQYQLLVEQEIECRESGRLTPSHARAILHMYYFHASILHTVYPGLGCTIRSGVHSFV